MNAEHSPSFHTKNNYEAAACTILMNLFLLSLQRVYPLQYGTVGTVEIENGTLSEFWLHGRCSSSRATFELRASSRMKYCEFVPGVSIFISIADTDIRSTATIYQHISNFFNVLCSNRYCHQPSLECMAFVHVSSVVSEQNATFSISVRLVPIKHFFNAATGECDTPAAKFTVFRVRFCSSGGTHTVAHRTCFYLARAGSVHSPIRLCSMMCGECGSGLG